jgi:hypothetical protein
MLPPASEDLTRASGENRDGRTGEKVFRCTALVEPRRLIIPAAITLVLLGSGVTALHFKGERMHRDRAGFLAHAAITSEIPIGVEAGLGDLRLKLRSAKWVRHTVPSSAEGRHNRLYLEAASAFDGLASTREIGGSGWKSAHTATTP